MYRRMTVGANLVFLGRLAGLSIAASEQRIDAWTKRLEIADWVDRRVEELSKGMQQKIQFIAALLHDPDLIVMDEPFAGLDPVNTMQLKDVLVGLRAAGKSVLFSTHRMDQVEKLCDSICLINRGKAVLQGSLSEVKASNGRLSCKSTMKATAHACPAIRWSIRSMTTATMRNCASNRAPTRRNCCRLRCAGCG